MSPPHERRRPPEEAAPESKAGGQDDTIVLVADGYRQALAIADLDPAPLGVRDHGPLNWSPEPPSEGERLAPVAIAQDRHLARRRVEAKFRRLRELRAVVAYWREVA
jgi:hypothetical protein